MSLRQILLMLVVAFHALSGISAKGALSPKRVSADPLIDWNAPFKVTPTQVAQFFQPMASGEKPAFSSKMIGSGLLRQEFNVRRVKEPEHELTFLNGRFGIVNLVTVSKEGKIHQCWIGLKSPEKMDVAFRESVDREISQIMGVAPVECNPMKLPGGVETKVLLWPNREFAVTSHIYQNGYVVVEILDPAYPGTLLPTTLNPSTSQEITASARAFPVDLDALLQLDQFWNCTVEDFEKKYPRKTEEFIEAPNQFEWLDAGKSRARFSRKLNPHLETRLTMFGKSIKVDEAIVEFVNGKVARATVIFYNRGDSGEIAAADFNNLFKKVGQNLGQVFKVAPTNQSAVASTAVKTVSWQWKSPTGIGLLEHNEFAAGGLVGQPEFLRLKLAAPDQADWSMGKLAVGVQKMALLKNITKNPNGDVFISGVPMVDQGAKGYCVAASCQRLFEYMRIPCDQHQIAQLVNVDAESGANIFGMQKSLAKIDGQFKVSFKPFINPELYYSGYGKRRVSQRQFSITVKEHVDKGVPLLWALELGRYPEDPPLPNGGQVSGGHMRLVIGYNPAKKEILFTDSWGAGHELKRMSEDAAYEVTLGLYSMSPRGL